MRIIVSFLNSEENFQYFIIRHDVSYRIFKDVIYQIEGSTLALVPMVTTQNLVAKNNCYTPRFCGSRI